MSSVSLVELAPRYLPSAPADALGVVSFGDRVLGPEPLLEVWPAMGDVIFGSVSVEETKPLEELTRDVYARLIDEVRAAGHPYFLRMWNQVGSLNEHERGLERYQLFCAGRHDAFVAAGYHHDVDLPAASAIGTPGRGLVVYFLAAREPGVQIENPRQVSAYHYPRQYGPKSPSFSRATIWRDTVFVSGTSSVVGHETAHVGDVLAQLEETLRNIEMLVPLEKIVAAKTFIRRAADYDAIARRLEGVFAANLFLEADICRPELLLEIEAVARK
jgi:chorismate lyase/3-hydroxybenzoate synthase